MSFGAVSGADADADIFVNSIFAVFVSENLRERARSLVTEKPPGKGSARDPPTATAVAGGERLPNLTQHSAERKS